MLYNPSHLTRQFSPNNGRTPFDMMDLHDGDDDNDDDGDDNVNDNNDNDDYHNV
jgi:hypothetical protein